MTAYELRISDWSSDLLLFRSGRSRVRRHARHARAALRVGAMKVSGRNVVLVAVGLLVVAVATAWWLYNYEYVETEVDLPPRGEARYTPLYALRLALQADGVHAPSRQRLQLDEVPLGARDPVLVLSDPRTLSPHDLDAPTDWEPGKTA